MHIRRSILRALRDQLKTLPLFAGVWVQRVPPSRNAWPCITVYAIEESVITQTQDNFPSVPRDQDRIVSVAVTGWMKGGKDDEKNDEDLDRAAETIEICLRNTVWADDMVLVATDPEVSEDDPEINRITLTYHIKYFTLEYSPSA